MEKDFNSSILKYKEKPNYILNYIKSFLFGGIICVIGQLFLELFQLLNFSFIESSALMSLTLIFIASLLTGFGIYDKLGQTALSGTIIPITGFANSITSAMLEHKSEGLFYGIGSNAFKLAGSVIVYGFVSAFLFAFLRFVFQ